MKYLIFILASAALFMAGCSTSPGTVSIDPTRERPGIGTTWGEQRESWVEKASFVRGWIDRPGGTGMLYYNDNEGVDAMLDYLGGEAKRRTGLYPTANGLAPKPDRSTDSWGRMARARPHSCAFSPRSSNRMVDRRW